MAERTCTIDGCTSRERARGWCSKHWARWRRYGDPLGKAPAVSLLERCLAFIAVGDGCWLWQGTIKSNGYGQISVNGRQQYAHRVVFEQMIGPIPQGLSLDHLCRTPACVRPDHLEPVTHRVNVIRGVSPLAVNAAKTRCNRGHPLSGDNLRLRREGYRNCKECDRMRRRGEI